MMPYYFPYFDPLSLLYIWPSLWMSYISMIYYFEMYRLMLETWRKSMESLFTTLPAPPRPSGS
ncbi:MAG: hypothetical protein B6U69_02200 [Thermofilum sp. ex4484_15]|nr:MAG: hypothetical protein B6U69_02200 [Thermofilum sp. ex4484_15]